MARETRMASRALLPVATASAQDDLDLVRRIECGDEAAFELLMRRHNRMLYRAARAILKNDADAEDALQEAYLRAYRGIATFRGHAKLSSWLVRIVVNEALARVRKHGRERVVIPFAPEIDDEHDQPAEDAMKPEQPDQATLRAEIRCILERRIDELPAAFRVVFMLRAVEEMSVEETAQALDIPEPTVRTRFFRARGLLRESLARQIDGAMDEAFSFDGDRCDRIVAGVLGRLRSGVPPDT